MSLNKNILSLLCASFLLTACQFERVHRPQEVIHNTSYAQKFVIKIKGLEGPVAYKLRRALEAELALIPRRDTKLYHLVIQLSQEHAELGYGGDATVVRAQQRLRADYQVIKGGDSTPLVKDQSIFASSYNINSDEPYSTLITHKDSFDRIIPLMARDIAQGITVLMRDFAD